MRCVDSGDEAWSGIARSEAGQMSAPRVRSNGDQCPSSSTKDTPSASLPLPLLSSCLQDEQKKTMGALALLIGHTAAIRSR